MRRTVLFFCLAFSPVALAHSGGTDASGCHTNHSTGEYHCHNPKSAKAPKNKTPKAPSGKAG